MNRKLLLAIWAAGAAMSVAYAIPKAALGNPPRESGTYSPPRLSDGTPDFRGIWQARTTAYINIEGHAKEKGIAASKSVVIDTPDGKIPYLPDARKQRDENFAKRESADPASNCFQAGVPRAVYLATPFQIFQSPGNLAIVYTDAHAYRIVDPSTLPHDDGIDYFMGDSRDRWDRNTLVIDVVDLGDQTWLDEAGNYHSDQLHVVERYTLVGPDTMQYEARLNAWKARTGDGTTSHPPIPRPFCTTIMQPNWQPLRRRVRIKRNNNSQARAVASQFFRDLQKSRRDAGATKTRRPSRLLGQAGATKATAGHPDCPLATSLVVSTIALAGGSSLADSGVTSLGSRSRLSLLLMIVLAVALTDCQQQINFPAPVLTALSPNSIQAGEPTFTLTVTGKSFTPSSSIEWNGQTLSSPSNPGLPSTIFVSSTTLSVSIPAILIQNGGVAQVQVSTPQPGGGMTLALPFTINASASSVPEITSISPTGAFAGNAGFTLTVTGKNFVSQSTVTVNGNNHATTFIGSTSLQTSIFAADVATSGTLQIAVVNPPPNGGSSSSFPLAVKNQTPSLTSLSPTSATAGGATTTITLTGVSFVPNSVVTMNGAARTTTFVGSTSLEASLTAGDLASAGISQVQVVSPAPGGGTSNIVTFAVNPTDLFGLPMLVDLALDGSQADDGLCGATCTGTIPTLSTAGPAATETGALVAFASNSTNLLANPTTGLSNIFLRNTCLATTTTTTGVSCTPSTSEVSLTPSGVAPDGSSSQPSLDSGGTHVAYTSTASNLVNYVTVSGAARQVYWQPTCSTTTGVTSTCAGTATGTAALVSISADGSTPGNGDSYDPAISADGQYVAFVSLATNLVQNVIADGVTPQVYIRNTCNLVPPASTGCIPTTYLVSTADGTTPGDAASSNPAIGNDGLFVAFASSASNLGATAPNPGGAAEIFESSTCVTTLETSSNTCVPATNLVSTPDGVTPADGASVEPTISSDGRFVAFSSTGTTLIAGVGPTQEVYMRDTCTGAATAPACVASTHLISTPNGTTPANALSEHPSINQCGSVTTTCSSGQYVAFASVASNFGANTANGIENIFVRDTCEVLPSTTTLCVPYTFLASQAGGATPPPSDGNSIFPAISGDGASVNFISSADNLVARDTNALPDIFLAGANLTFGLAVTLNGTGSGTVTDGTGQISCTQTAATSTTPLAESGTCTARYASGTSVSLTATATGITSSTFTGWGGSATSVSDASCTVTTGTNTSGTCTFSEIQNNTATATFH